MNAAACRCVYIGGKPPVEIAIGMAKAIAVTNRIQRPAPDVARNDRAEHGLDRMPHRKSVEPGTVVCVSSGIENVIAGSRIEQTPLMQ